MSHSTARPSHHFDRNMAACVKSTILVKLCVFHCLSLCYKLCCWNVRPYISKHDSNIPWCFDPSLEKCPRTPMRRPSANCDPKWVREEIWVKAGQAGRCFSFTVERTNDNTNVKRYISVRSVARMKCQSVSFCFLNTGFILHCITKLGKLSIPLAPFFLFRLILSCISRLWVT